MADQPKTSRSLSDISHLFLSSVREKQTGGASRPTRRPPGSPDREDLQARCEAEAKLNHDLEPAEFRQAFSDDEECSEDSMRIAPVTALIASHLGAGQYDAARRYARNLASTGQRVGLIFIDCSEFRLATFTPWDGPDAEPTEAEETGVFDARAMTDAINELNCDLDCWLLLVGNPRVAEGRSLLSKMGHWVLLSTTSHDGVVSCYRTLKGLADLDRPRLSLAALDAKDPEEADQVFRKLASVCGQFLDWCVEPEPAVLDVSGVAEVPVMLCRTSGDKAQIATAAHWQVVMDLLENASGSEAADDAKPQAAVSPAVSPAAALPRKPILRSIEPVTEDAYEDETPAAPSGLRLNVEEREMPNTANKPAMSIPISSSPFHNTNSPGPMPASAPVMSYRGHEEVRMPEVIDLPEGELTDGVVAAMMKHSMNEVVECPVRPPMCPQARLAVTRDRRIVVIAMAGRGLTDLRAIGLAYRWVVENRTLLSMAMPQFALDAHQHPHLRLLVDQHDVDADVLQPIFQVDTVSIHTYRRVRWGERTGLLLNAA